MFCSLNLVTWPQGLLTLSSDSSHCTKGTSLLLNAVDTEGSHFFSTRAGIFWKILDNLLTKELFFPVEESLEEGQHKRWKDDTRLSLYVFGVLAMFNILKTKLPNQFPSFASAKDTLWRPNGDKLSGLFPAKPKHVET